jgi:hypothetical protein
MTISPDHLQRAFGARFEIERELGQGGMAVVYLAYDTAEDRQVALKVMLPELAAAVGAERFLKEIHIGTRLSHTHILPLFGSGQEDGLLYYTMQYVDGETLRDRLDREGQLPADEALDIACEVASALDYAHRQGVVHRDIKPENIMLSEGGAVVMDFGIARALDEAGGERLTRTGLSMGTPAYMAPEQADRADRLDGRADQYSLACVLYEMLAGHPPFQGSSAQAVLSRHARDPVPPLSSARPTVSLPVEAVIHTALAKVPADRFRTAAKFSDALDMAEQGVTPRGVTPAVVTPHATQPVRRGSLFGELKRRRVYSVATAYAVVAFTIVQGLDATAEPLGISPQLHALAIWIAILGFPVVVLLAWWYELTPQGVRRTQAVPLTPSTGTVLTPRHRRLMVCLVAAVAVLGLWFTLRPGGGSGDGSVVDLDSVSPRDLSRAQIVVMPFRVSGGDPALDEGFATLLDGALHGPESLRSWDFATVADLRTGERTGRAGEPSQGAALSQEDALRLAVRLGARRLVEDGFIVQTGQRLTISASLVRVPTGTTLAQETVEGSVEDLRLLANRLAALLLDEGWADAVTREELKRVPPPALEAYLAGKRADLREDRLQTRENAQQALELYPEYADAAYLLWSRAAGAGPIPSGEGGEAVYGFLDRLSRRKQTWFDVNAGTRSASSAVAGSPRRSRGAEELVAVAERAYEINRGWPELADLYARRLFRLGAYAGRLDPLESAHLLLQEAYELWENDGRSLIWGGFSGLEAVWLVRTAGWTPDTAGLRTMAAELLANPLINIRRYHVALVLDDRRALDSLRAAGLHSIDPSFFRDIGTFDGRPGPDALVDFQAAIDTARGKVITPRNRSRVNRFELWLAILRGRIEQAADLVDTLSRVSQESVASAADLTLPIEHALVEPGWDEAAAKATRELAGRGSGPGYGEFQAVCYPALGKLLAGDTSTAAEAVRRMDEQMQLAQTGAWGVCPRMIEALIERREDPNGPRVALTRLDSLMRLGPQESLWASANLVLAEMFRERGDTARALEAVKRRAHRQNAFVGFMPSYLALEGELSLPVGDTTGARHAFEHYLRLRTDPDPPLQEQKARVDSLLAALSGGR